MNSLLSKKFFDNKNITFILILLVGLSAIWSRSHFVPETGIEWRTLLAERVLAGKKIGTDIYEINTPFSTLLYVPSIIISHFFNIEPFIATYTITTLFIFFCIYISALILRYRGYDYFQNPATLNIFKISFFSAFLFFTSLSFSQREHFIIACLLPYTLLVYSPLGFKEHPDEPEHGLNYLVCILASLSFFIKPHYILSIILIRILAFLFKKNTSFYWPECIILLLSAALFIFSLVFIYPGWLQVARDAIAVDAGPNAGWNNSALLSLGEGTITQLLAIILIYKSKQPVRTFAEDKSFVSPILILCAVNALIVLFQQKGCFYLRFPVTLPLWGLTLFKCIEWLYALKNSWIIPLSCTALIINYSTLTYYQSDFLNTTQQYEQGWPQRLKPFLSPGAPFACITFYEPCPFAVIHLEKNNTYISRYSDMWPTINAKMLFNKQMISNKTFLRFLNHDTKNILEDIHKTPPQAIIVDWWENKENHAIQDFGNEPGFIAALKQYRLIEHIEHQAPPGTATWVFIRK